MCHHLQHHDLQNCICSAAFSHVSSVCHVFGDKQVSALLNFASLLGEKCACMVHIYLGEGLGGSQLQNLEAPHGA
jgi:hypothetical protein